MNILACIKRVPATGGRVSVTDDGRSIDARFLSFTISPHEECAVEEAVRLAEAAGGGTTTVLTLGPEAAADQLRDALAVGMTRAVHLVTDGEDWDPLATAAAIVDAIHADAAEGITYDLLLFGNEAADSGDYQVPVRVAAALKLPWLTGIKAIDAGAGLGEIRARRDGPGGQEVYEVQLPAVLAVREGLNRPRYPSIPGRLRAKKAPIIAVRPDRRDGGPTLVRLRVQDEAASHVQLLGRGTAAAPAVADLLEALGLVRR
jgi:electron transfer flavoprotein beta subunit